MAKEYRPTTYPLRRDAPYFRQFLPKVEGEVSKCRRCDSPEHDAMLACCGNCGLSDEMNESSKRVYKKHNVHWRPSTSNRRRRGHGRSAPDPSRPRGVPQPRKSYRKLRKLVQREGSPDPQKA